jgi:hypothetical protein
VGGDIPLYFETMNKYAARNESGAGLCYEAEESGSIIFRWFLKALRPFQ